MDTPTELPKRPEPPEEWWGICRQCKGPFQKKNERHVHCRYCLEGVPRAERYQTKCKHCAKRFTSTTDHRRYCSTKCRRAAAADRQRRRKEKQRQERIRRLECEHCGKEFVTSDRRAKYCNRICKERAQLAKRLGRQRQLLERVEHLEAQVAELQRRAPVIVQGDVVAAKQVVHRSKSQRSKSQRNGATGTRRCPCCNRTLQHQLPLKYCDEFCAEQEFDIERLLPPPGIERRSEPINYEPPLWLIARRCEALRESWSEADYEQRGNGLPDSLLLGAIAKYSGRPRQAWRPPSAALAAEQRAERLLHAPCTPAPLGEGAEGE